jgi:exodeoxyribonuclease-5
MYQYNFNSINLESAFKLNIQQESALTLIINDFIESEAHQIFTLTGYAGTGKTSIIGLVEQYLYQKQKSLIFASPSHKANIILRSKVSSDVPIFTIHKLLKLKPQLQLEDFDLDKLEFQLDKKRLQEEEDLLPDYIIFEESSMINDDLYKFIIDELIDKGVKVIFMGDSSQLRPVKQLTRSKCLVSPLSYQLTLVERTNSPAILNLLNLIRNNEKIILEDNEDYKFTNSLKTFKEYGLEKFKLLQDDEYACRVICGTNTRVNFWNDYFHKNLFEGSDREYNIGELILSYKGSYSKFCNSMEAVISKIEDTYFIFDDIPYRGYNITLTNGGQIKVLSENNDFSRIPAYIKTLPYTKEYKFKGKNVSKVMWGDYYSFLNEYFFPVNIKDEDNKVVIKRGIDYGYAITTHKSQGSTYSNAMVDLVSFKPFLRDKENYFEMLYVAFSRVSENFLGYSTKYRRSMKSEKTVPV